MQTIKKELSISRSLKCSRQLAWKIWTDPKHVSEWWGPKGFTNPVCIWDAKPGNKIYIEMKTANGIVHPMNGEFIEVVKPEKLVFLTAKLGEKGERLLENMHTLIFSEKNGITTITLHITVMMVTRSGESAIKGMNIGWNQSLDRFEECIKKYTIA